MGKEGGKWGKLERESRPVDPRPMNIAKSNMRNNLINAENKFAQK